MLRDYTRDVNFTNPLIKKEKEEMGMHNPAGVEQILSCQRHIDLAVRRKSVAPAVSFILGNSPVSSELKLEAQAAQVSLAGRHPFQAQRD